ncbi:hypothetical protein BaRGS_00005442 [Batillaria attramentaria]|uniref:Uncharacterized protein n=1 Tax=Batillaria attramentaria TaxID=370345 RepID=A0ABD0LUL6_9CAEN
MHMPLRDVYLKVLTATVKCKINRLNWRSDNNGDPANKPAATINSLGFQPPVGQTAASERQNRASSIAQVSNTRGRKSKRSCLKMSALVVIGKRLLSFLTRMMHEVDYSYNLDGSWVCRRN